MSSFQAHSLCFAWTARISIGKSNDSRPVPIMPTTLLSPFRFSETHGFKKPNDLEALQLMNATAQSVMRSMKGMILGYGQSDEYSFVLPSNTTLFQRRSSKLVSTVASLFGAYYTFLWPKFKPNVPLTYPPSFDCRAVMYPSLAIVRDYLSWRQADCHINNLYNTCFWNLVQGSGLSRSEAEKRLAGTSSGDKNELLFSTFHINYSKIDEIYRKGTIVVPSTSDFELLYTDLIGNPFWDQYGHLFK